MIGPSAPNGPPVPIETADDSGLSSATLASIRRPASEKIQLQAALDDFFNARVIEVVLDPDLIAKAAAGAIEYVPIAVVPGIPAALQTLAAAGVWTIGLDGGGGLDFVVLVGATRAEPISVELRKDAIDVTLDLAEAKEALQSIAAAVGEELDLPAVMTGRLGFNLTRRGPRHIEISAGVRSAVEISGTMDEGPFELKVATRDPALRVDLDADAGWTAAALADPALGQPEGAELIQKLVPVAAANPTALDTVLARLLLAARPTDSGLLDALLRLADEARSIGATPISATSSSGVLVRATSSAW